MVNLTGISPVLLVAKTNRAIAYYRDRLGFALWNVYVRVDDVDSIYAERQERGALIDYTIYDTPHGFREFGVQGLDGRDIAFGQRVSD